MMNVTVQRYVAIYHHEFGVDSWVFDYVPTKELPVPSVKRVVEYFNVHFEPHLGETLELVRVNDPANLETLTAEQVGGDGVSIETFEEDEDEEEPPEPDDPDEPPYRWL